MLRLNTEFLISFGDVLRSFNFQLPQYKRFIIVSDTKVAYDLGGSLSVGQCPLSLRFHHDIKVSLFQYQDLNVRLISQIDIVICLIYNISAISWQHQEQCHSDIAAISDGPTRYSYDTELNKKCKVIKVN